MTKKAMNKKKLLIIMSNSDPSKPESCYAPLFQATIAAAWSHEVEVVLTGTAGQLLGVIEGHAMGQPRLIGRLDAYIGPAPRFHDHFKGCLG